MNQVALVAIFFLAVIIVALILRCYILLKYKWIGKDSFYHLIVARLIREEKSLPEVIDLFLIPERYDYPPLFHIILSCFDEKYHQKIQFLSAFADMIIGLMVFLFCLKIYNIWIAIAAMTLYLMTPLSLNQSLVLGPRSLGNLFMALSLFSLYFYYLEKSMLALFFSISFCSLILLTHRLTTQSILIVIIFLTIYFRSEVYIYVIIMSLLIAIISTKGFYIKVALGHLKFLKIFSKKLIEKRTRKEIANMFPNPITILFNMPMIALFPFFFMSNLDSNKNFLLIWASALILLSAIWLLGEGNRHLENSVPAFAILSSILLIETDNCTMLIVFIFLSAICSIIKILRLERNPQYIGITDPNWLEGYRFIKNNKNERDILLSLPLDMTYNAAYFTGCIVLQSGGGFAEGLDFNRKLHEMVKLELIEDLVNDYNVNWIITDAPDNWDILGKKMFSSGKIRVWMI